MCPAHPLLVTAALAGSSSQTQLNRSPLPPGTEVVSSHQSQLTQSLRPTEPPSSAIPVAPARIVSVRRLVEPVVLGVCSCLSSAPRLRVAVRQQSSLRRPDRPRLSGAARILRYTHSHTDTRTVLPYCVHTRSSTVQYRTGVLSRSTAPCCIRHILKLEFNATQTRFLNMKKYEFWMNEC